jgi:PPOX class probable F420-dependent enzyme
VASLSDEQRTLLSRPIHAWATVHRPDGSLHSTVVWVDVDGEDVVFNTAVGRAKERHLRRDPRVGISALSPDDEFRYVSIAGTATLDTAGADDVIDALARKYLGVDRYPYRRADEQRINVRVRPDTVIWSAGRGGPD